MVGRFRSITDGAVATNGFGECRFCPSISQLQHCFSSHGRYHHFADDRCSECVAELRSVREYSTYCLFFCFAVFVKQPIGDAINQSSAFTVAFSDAHRYRPPILGSFGYGSPLNVTELHAHQGRVECAVPQRRAVRYAIQQSSTDGYGSTHPAPLRRPH